MNALVRATAAFQAVIINAFKLRKVVQVKKSWRIDAAACVRSLNQVSNFLDFMLSQIVMDKEAIG